MPRRIASLVLALVLAPLATAAADRPNVLFIAIDDLNDWVGALGGHPQARTPGIDRLAERGVLFTRAYTAAPACNPSRVALLTGLAPYRTGVYSNNQPWRPVLPDATTIPRLFRENGYWVGGSGKIFHRRFTDPPAWDVFHPSNEQQRPGGAGDEATWVDASPRGLDFAWGTTDAEPSAMSDWKAADWVIARLHEKRDEPFFLALGIFQPHPPWRVPPEYLEGFPLESIELPPIARTDLRDVPPVAVELADPRGNHLRIMRSAQHRQAVRAYLASVRFADEQVGRVLDALEASPHREDTVIVLWSDHGWHLGEKKHWRKATLWEEATRVPLIIAVPKGVAALPEGSAVGGRSPRVVSLMDVYPTLIELAGLEPKPELSGRSLVKLLEDPEAEWKRPAITTLRRGNYAVRSERYRYIRYADGSEELYDHARDPMEWTNLAGSADHEEVIEDLAGYLPGEEAPDAPTGTSNSRKKRKQKGGRAPRRERAAP